MYHQHLEGHLDPRVWREVETLMRDLINTGPGIQAWWRLYSDWFGEEFVNYVNQQQQTATRQLMISSQHVYEVRPRKRSSQRRSDFRCAAIRSVYVLFSSERKCLTADLFGIKTTPPFALWLIWLIARPASMVQRRNSY